MSDESTAIVPTTFIGELSQQWDRVMNAPAMIKEESMFGSDPDAAILQLMSLESLKERLSDAAKMVEKVRQAWGIEQVKRHGKALFPYYAGQEKTEKCRDPRKLFDHLMAFSDIDTICSLLSAGAWKPGACKQVLGEEFDKHFETTIGPKLKESEGQKATEAKLLKVSTFGR